MDTLTLIVQILIGGLIGIILGSVIEAMLIRRRIRQLKEEIASGQIQMIKNIELVAEVHGNVAYFYNKNTGEFVAQGTSAEEVFNHILARKFYNTRFTIGLSEVNKAPWLKDIFTQMVSN